MRKSIILYLVVVFVIITILIQQYIYSLQCVSYREILEYSGTTWVSKETGIFIKVDKELCKVLEIITENNGNLPFEHMDVPWGEIEQFFNPFESFKPGNESLYSTRYFVVEMKNNKVLRVETEHIDGVTAKMAHEYASQIYRTQEPGFGLSGHLLCLPQRRAPRRALGPQRCWRRTRPSWSCRSSWRRGAVCGSCNSSGTAARR